MQLWFILLSLEVSTHLIVGLLAAGAISAAFSTVSGLLVAGASAFSHDLYVKVINPSSTPKQQLKIARIGTVIMALLLLLLLS